MFLGVGGGTALVLITCSMTPPHGNQQRSPLGGSKGDPAQGESSGPGPVPPTPRGGSFGGRGVRSQHRRGGEAVWELLVMMMKGWR